MDVILHYKDHSEWAHLAVTDLRKQDVILGYTWLQEHNPEVNWNTKEETMLCCPGHCSTCRTEIKQEHHQHQTEACHLCAYHTSSMHTVEEIFKNIPELYLDTEDDAEDDAKDDTEVPEEIEEGDWIFMTTVYNQAEFI